MIRPSTWLVVIDISQELSPPILQNIAQLSHLKLRRSHSSTPQTLCYRWMTAYTVPIVLTQFKSVGRVVLYWTIIFSHAKSLFRPSSVPLPALRVCTILACTDGLNPCAAGNITLSWNLWQKQFAALFTMAFDDDSRLVVKEHVQSRATPTLSSSPFSHKRESQSATQASSDAVPHPTIACVQTFSTGLVVTTCSDGTVSPRELHYDTAALQPTARSGIAVQQHYLVCWCLI